MVASFGDLEYTGQKKELETWTRRTTMKVGWRERESHTEVIRNVIEEPRQIIRTMETRKT
jgi:hypothetical protein